MNATLSNDDVLKLRMRALRLESGSPTVSSAEGTPGADRIASVTAHMLAVQGQDWRSARWALGVRTPGTAVNDVYEAFNAGKIVRSWPMRGTVHIVAAEDIGWMQRALNHRVLSGAPKRREYLGLSDSVLERLVNVSVAALREHSGMSRDQLADTWTEAGFEWHSNWRYHVVWWLCQNGYATMGPVGDGGEPLLVAADTWIRGTRNLDGDEALVELAARYFGAHGPAREKDFAWWTGLTIREARHSIALAAQSDRIISAQLTDSPGSANTLWISPQLLDSTPARATDITVTDDLLLLPAFDEHLLGYTHREPQLHPQHIDRIVPGRNGIFLATVVNAGKVVGTWKRNQSKGGGVNAVEFPDAQIDPKHLASAATRWADFHNVVEMPVMVSPAPQTGMEK